MNAISSENGAPKAEIVAVMKPLEVTDFLPKVEYHLQGVTVSTEALDLKSMFHAFLEENKELITNGTDTSNMDALDSFTKGFRNAVAITQLWIDSMYITQ